MTARDLVSEARESVKTLMADEGWKRHSDVAKYLNINSAFIYLLFARNILRPTMYEALVESKLLRPLPLTIEMNASTAAIILSVANFKKRRQPKNNQALDKPKRAPRISIQKENPELAAKAIKAHMKPEHIEQLIDDLLKEIF